MKQLVTSFVESSRRRSSRRGTHRLAVAMLLSFVVLFACQGAWRHEISHLATIAKSLKHQSPANHEPCSLCLSFAHLNGAPQTDTFAPHLLTHLAYGLSKESMPVVATSIGPAPRSRGPPSV